MGKTVFYKSKIQSNQSNLTIYFLCLCANAVALVMFIFFSS